MEEEKGQPQATHTHNDNSAHSQRTRLVAALELRSVTTIEARRDLDILMPAARVFELRARGYDIETLWVDDLTECGRRHRVARYWLRKPVS